MPRVILTIQPGRPREVDESELVVLQGQGLVAEVLPGAATDDPPPGGKPPSAGDGETPNESE